MANSDIREHISAAERAKWDKCVVDFYNHLGAGGTANHMLATGNGSGSATNPVNTANGTPGFTQCNYTPVEKGKLGTVEWNANHYVHPSTHPASMITGLNGIATTGSWNYLVNIPAQFPGDARTVSGGIRITIGASAPGSPVNNKEIWMNTSDKLTYVYTGSKWVPWCAVFG